MYWETTSVWKILTRNDVTDSDYKGETITNAGWFAPVQVILNLIRLHGRDVGPFAEQPSNHQIFLLVSLT